MRIHLFSRSYSSYFCKQTDDVELGSALLHSSQAQAVAHLSSPPEEPLAKLLTCSGTQHSCQGQQGHHRKSWQFLPAPLPPQSRAWHRPAWRVAAALRMPVLSRETALERAPQQPGTSSPSPVPIYAALKTGRRSSSCTTTQTITLHF